jgi:hypothetical protein
MVLSARGKKSRQKSNGIWGESDSPMMEGSHSHMEAMLGWAAVLQLIRCNFLGNCKYLGDKNRWCRQWPPTTQELLGWLISNKREVWWTDSNHTKLLLYIQWKLEGRGVAPLKGKEMGKAPCWAGEWGREVGTETLSLLTPPTYSASWQWWLYSPDVPLCWSQWNMWKSKLSQENNFTFSNPHVFPPPWRTPDTKTIGPCMSMPPPGCWHSQASMTAF